MKFVAELLAQHLQRYPRMTLADIYKLLHQAAMGPGHAIAGEDQARAALAEECARLAAGPSEPLVDPISPDGRLARIHLRAYLAEGRDPALLGEALLRTAREIPGAPDKLMKFCACLGDLADTGRMPFERAGTEACLDDMRRRCYPVVRHSEDYRQVYRPAYRVVAVDFLP
jgi:hypothetical protein